MRALLSAVGTRGDVQPIVALALRVRDLGHEVRLCVPPNFLQWVGGFGFEAVGQAKLAWPPLGMHCLALAASGAQ
jgi:vancomycin aglycone glucosyltransferase